MASPPYADEWSFPDITGQTVGPMHPVHTVPMASVPAYKGLNVAIAGNPASVAADRFGPSLPAGMDYPKTVADTANWEQTEEWERSMAEPEREPAEAPATVEETTVPERQPPAPAQQAPPVEVAAVEAVKPTPPPAAPNPAYKPGFKQQAAALGIDLLMGSNPVTMGLNVLSLIGLGTTVGGAIMNAVGGKYGENLAKPGTTQEREQGGATQEARTEGGYGTNVKPKTAKEEAATFEEKYLTFHDPTWRPTPVQKWGPEPTHSEYV